MATGLEGGGCLNDPRLPTKRDSLYGFRQAHASWGKEKVSKIRYVLIFQPGFHLTECSREPQNDSREFYDLVGGKKDAKCGKLMYIYSTGTSARCSAIMWRLEDGWGEGGSRGRGHMYTYG